MKFSRFGDKFAGTSLGSEGDAGIVSLMADLGDALRVNPEMIFMGGGNPSRIPEVESVLRQQLQTLIDDKEACHKMLGVYQSPQGDEELLEQLALLLREEFDWPISEKNIAISNGSQSAFFVLFNLFSGVDSDGRKRKIQLPLAPEYLGYADLGLEDDMFAATQPNIELLDDNLFKYRVDFDALNIDDSCGALCVSRPTNPTGNVLTDEEMHHLDSLARKAGIPLIIDGAYGTPFPNIIFTEAEPLWNDNTIMVLSLSKLGLPGVRTGIVIASEEVISAFASANTILSLACGNVGPALASGLCRDKSLLKISRQYIKPFYQVKAELALGLFRRYLGDLPWRIHKPEGAIFLWLWFEGLPIDSEQLYQRLKSRGVLVVSGHHFFPGLNDPDWRHSRECIRVTYSQDAETIERGIAIIADEVKKAYGV